MKRFAVLIVLAVTAVVAVLPSTALPASAVVEFPSCVTVQNVSGRTSGPSRRSIFKNNCDFTIKFCFEGKGEKGRKMQSKNVQIDRRTVATVTVPVALNELVDLDLGKTSSEAWKSRTHL